MQFKSLSLITILAISSSGVVWAQSQDPASAGNPYSFGGSCASQGSWTQAALRSTQEIISVTEKLRDDKNCKVLTDTLAKLDLKSAAYDLDASSNASDSATNPDDVAKGLNLPGETAALQTAMTSDPSLRGKASSLLLKKIMEELQLNTQGQLKRRIKKASYSAVQLFNQFAKVLPDSELCLADHPDTGVTILGGIMTLAGSMTAVNGEGLLGEFGRSLGVFLGAIRTTKYNQIIRKLYQSQYWTSISCLIETTTENYCAVKDANNLRDFMNLEVDLRKRVEKEGARNPLRGYYILEREVGIVSEWLQKVQMGVEPRTMDQASAKNMVLQNSTNFYQTRNTLLATYNQAMINIRSYQSITAKKNAVFGMLQSLVDGIVGAGTPGGTTENFFTLTKNITFIPFYLLGMSALPAEVRSQSSNTNFDWRNWIATQGPEDATDGTAYIPEFNNPDALAEIMYTRLVSLMNEAELNASAYYRNMFIVDVETLINETIVSQTVNVYQSLKNIYAYLGDVQTWISSQRKLSDEDKFIIPSIQSTRMRIKLIIDSYDNLMRLGAKYLGTNESDVMDHIRQDFEWAKRDGNAGIPTRISGIFGDLSFKNAYAKIMQSALDAFNIVLQKDTFLFTRLSPIVRYDFTKRIQLGGSTSYQNDLLIINGKNLLDRMRASTGNNAAATKLDLSQAQWINRQNMAAVEELFAQTLLPLAMQTKLVAEDRLSVATVQQEAEKSNAYTACLSYVIDKKESKIIDSKSFKDCMDFTSRDGFTRWLSVTGAGMAMSGGGMGVPVMPIQNDPMWNIMEYNSYLARAEGKTRSAFKDLIKTGRTGIGYASTIDDPSKSAATLWGKVCIQSLAFNFAHEYFYLCQNSFLQGYSAYADEAQTWSEFVKSAGVHNYENYVTFNDHQSSASYNGLMKRFMYEPVLDKQKEWRDQNMCALRSHMRRSYVYWLTTITPDKVYSP